jgi:hypothetical protein
LPGALVSGHGGESLRSSINPGMVQTEGTRSGGMIGSDFESGPPSAGWVFMATAGALIFRMKNIFDMTLRVKNGGYFRCSRKN